VAVHCARIPKTAKSSWTRWVAAWPSQGTIMHQRWEYSLLSAYWTSDSGWTMRLGPETTLDNWGQIMMFVGELGDQGWELVSTTSINYPSGVIEYAFAFKRIKLGGDNSGPNGATG
jgi:hypothetical protein